MAVMDLDDRRLTIAYMMNERAPGIIGSVRSAAYIRALGVETPAGTSPDAHLTAGRVTARAPTAGRA